MKCTGIPTLGSTYWHGSPTNTLKIVSGCDGRYTVNPSYAVAQKFIPNKQCMSGIQFRGVYKGGSMRVEVRNNQFCSGSGQEQTVPVGYPGESKGLVASTVIPATWLSSNGVTQGDGTYVYTYMFSTPFAILDTTKYYHLVFSATSFSTSVFGGCAGAIFAFSICDGSSSSTCKGTQAVHTSVSSLMKTCDYWYDLGDVLWFGVLQQDYGCVPTVSFSLI